MSGRTVPRFALIGLLAATLTAPAVAQEARPTAPMPRAKNRPDLAAFSVYDRVNGPLMPNPVPPELPVPTMTPPATPAFPRTDVFEFSVELRGDGKPQSFTRGFGSYCAPAIPRLVAPATQQQFTLRDAPRIVLIGGEDVFAPTCPPCPLPRIAPNPLLGTWYRELPGTVISATFTHDELKLYLTQSVEGHTASCTITAHYTLTKDGLVYGAITGADVDIKIDPKTGESPFDSAVVELATGLQQLVDAPFSFRTKMTSAGLMVSGLKCSTQMAKGETDIFGGMFKPAKDGRVPVPVSLNTTRKAAPPVVGAAIGTVTGATTGALIGNDAYKLVPATPDCQRVGIDFNTNPPRMIAPAVPGGAYVPVAPPCQTPQPVKPVGGGVPDDSTKQLATEAFGQLLQQSGVTRPITDASVMGGMTLPSGRYLDHFPQYFAPDPVFPMPRELACPSAAVPPGPGASIHGTYIPTPATPSFVGTWYRDVAGKQCVVKVLPNHLTLTVSEAHNDNGKVSVASLVITADYHLTRDGLTAVGLITSVDVSFEGEFPQEDSKPFFEMLNELQKALEDKPFALTFRAYDLSLVIGNVRMPTVSDKMEVQPAGYMAGRYKSAGVQMPKPKAIKVTAEPKALPPAPSIYVAPSAGTQGLPYYVAPPPAPNSEMLPPQALPTPRVVPSSASEPVPSMTEPTPQMPQMPQPIPPAMSVNEEPKPAKVSAKVLIPGLMYANTSNPNIRMQQLLRESEDLRQITNEWRHFWFKDKPAHLTPERIHGGIY